MQPPNTITFEQLNWMSSYTQQAKTIYHQAFGHTKHLPFWCLRLNALRPNVQFWGLVVSGHLTGWLYLLVGRDTVYIYYCAIDKSLRSLGYGSVMMDWLKQQFPHHLLVLNLPLPDGHEKQRTAFYWRHGFRYANFYYTERGLSSNVMVHGGHLSATQYIALLRPFTFYCYPIRTVPRSDQSN